MTGRAHKALLKAGVVAAGFGLALAAAGVQAQTIKIGVNQPPHGAGRPRPGGFVVNGARIAADEINAKGGVLGQRRSSSSIEDNKEQPDRSRGGRREAHRARQGAGHDGRVELHPAAARGHAQAHGDTRVPMLTSRDLLLRQDHDLGQPLRVPHFARRAWKPMPLPIAWRRSRFAKPISSSSA